MVITASPWYPILPFMSLVDSLKAWCVPLSRKINLRTCTKRNRCLRPKLFRYWITSLEVLYGLGELETGPILLSLTIDQQAYYLTNDYHRNQCKNSVISDDVRGDKEYYPKPWDFRRYREVGESPTKRPSCLDCTRRCVHFQLHRVTVTHCLRSMAEALAR